ncbi:MAG: hypothetical protein JXA57_15115 [Armatimonadetes bacterium]|nr:hypothetical protein [Armatimonadota bacterium]
MVVPRIALQDELNRLILKDMKVRYVLRIVLPALGTGAGVLVASLFVQL